jgi:intracellular multiplication protein IcmN
LGFINGDYALRPLPHVLICWLAWVTKLLVVLLLASCASYFNSNEVKTLPQLPYKVDDARDSARVTIQQERLNDRGIQVITLGQEYLVSIPASLLFADQSPRIKWGSYPLLTDTACYLKQFRKITVHVTAYSSKYVSSQREHALTLARATAVANYLWSQGIDSRFIFAHGLGSNKPITRIKNGSDLSRNSRIEITFRDAIK